MRDSRIGERRYDEETHDTEEESGANDNETSRTQTDKATGQRNMYNARAQAVMLGWQSKSPAAVTD
jgi:hypothetical protein